MANLVQFLPLIVLIIIFYWWYRKYSRRSSVKTVDGIPVGVEGWLLVLVFGMLVLNPLRILDIIEKAYMKNGLTNNGAWITVAILVFLGAVSIYGGWGLAKGKTPNVVTRAKAALWVQMAAGAILLPMTMDGGISFIQSLIVATVWTLYLSKSKRVKVTYNLEKSPPIAKEMSAIPTPVQGTTSPAKLVTPKKAIVFRLLQFVWSGGSHPGLLVLVSITLVLIIIATLSQLESYKAASQPEPSEQAYEKAVREVLDEDARSRRFSTLLKKATEGDPNAQDDLGLMYWIGDSVPKDFTKAVEWWQKAAKQGNADAQVKLGTMYSNGDGVPKDETKAVEWWQKAAEQGYARGQTMLGITYGRGKVVPKDSIKAADLLQKAAEQGDADAQFLLGSMYVNGEGVLKDFTKAVEWWQKAAEQGNAQAQFYLGNLYAKGEGIPKDDTKAVDLYLKAAAQGYASAQSILGFMYANGIGVRKDYVRAYAWISLAAAQGDINGQQKQNRFEPLLTPEQRAEGQRLASNWKNGDTLDGNSSVAASGSGAPRKVSTGTAFIISKSGHAITNHHVIHDCAEVKIAGRDGVAKVITSDTVNDLALLQLPGEVNATASLSPTISKLKQGEDIIVFGYPLNSVLSSGGNLTPGIISAMTGLGNNTNQIQITAPIQPGSSGSPVMDKKGNVVGVVSMKLSDSVMAKATGQIGQNVNFAVNGQTVKAFLDGNKVPYETGGGFFSREKSNTDIAEEASKWTVLVECWK